MTPLRLCINIDHIATLRQARRGVYPDPVEGAAICERAGADGITAHLREDRRHIQDDDVERLATSVTTTFNLEMACTDEMLAIAERLRPHQVMFVPERRQEITTEGGLDVASDPRRIRAGIDRMKAAGIPTSLFIAADRETIDRSRELGPTAIELHTGPYVHAEHDPRQLRALVDGSKYTRAMGSPTSTWALSPQSRRSWNCTLATRSSVVRCSLDSQKPCASCVRPWTPRGHLSNFASPLTPAPLERA
jgi:pyridoxine 5-phosphate synthase